MRISLRLGKNQDISRTKNVLFSSDVSATFTIYPIPPFIKDPKCECGKSAELVLNDICMCGNCSGKKIGKTRLIEEDDTSIPITEHSIKRLRFEWSVDGNRWYYVYGRNIKPRNWKRFIEKLREMILRETEIELEAEYDKDTKEMTIL